MTVEDISRLFESHGRFRCDHLSAANCRHAPVTAALEALAGEGGGALAITSLGTSLEGRRIPEVRFGGGPVHVLLWSQMHGDEPTATLALCDIFSFLVHHRPAPAWVDTLLRRLSIHAIPMLNPDGAERPHRCTASLIDMNRDAVALRTPEARLLRGIHDRLRPSFAFNLHDQSVSSAGRSKSVSALAFLAPPPDEARTVTPARLAAMKLGAVVARGVQPFAAGHLTTYDDVYEARAFGDLFQAFGTPTLLIESGQWAEDPAKEFVRKLNFTGLLVALSAIAEGTVHAVDTADYVSLPVNGKMVVDVIVRNVCLQGPNGWSDTVDLALMRDRARHGALVLKELGDISVYGALQTHDAGGLVIRAEELRVDEPIDPDTIPGLS